MSFSDKSIRILVVDDVQTINKAIVSVLKSIGFENIVSAHDGQEAMNILLENTDMPFQLIFADINMPKMNGIEMVTKIRSTPEYSESKIIMISTEDQVETILNCVSAGADSYLLKPIERNILIDRVEKVLG